MKSTILENAALWFLVFVLDELLSVATLNEQGLCCFLNRVEIHLYIFADVVDKCSAQVSFVSLLLPNIK